MTEAQFEFIQKNLLVNDPNVEGGLLLKTDAVVNAPANTQYANNTAVANPTGIVALGFDGANVRALNTTNTGVLNVAVVSGGGSNLSVGTNGAAIPTSSTQIGASDGTNLQQLLVESSVNHNLRIGIYQGANEVTVTGANALKVDGSAVTQPISAVSLPLPTGAATSGNQATEIASLASIVSQLPATLGQKTMANSLAVTIASDQSTITTTNASVSATGAAIPSFATFAGARGVDVTALPSVTIGNLAGLVVSSVNNALVCAIGNLSFAQDKVDVTGSAVTITGTSTVTSPVTIAFRSFAITNGVSTTIKASAGNLYGWNIINHPSNAVSLFVKFYNKTGATSADTPIRVIQLPTNSTNQQEPNSIDIAFSTALSVRCVIGFADNDDTAPANLPLVQVSYI